MPPAQIRIIRRGPVKKDFFQWYCDSCNFLLYEVELQLKDIVKQLPPLFEGFWKNDDARTCNQCNSYLIKP